MTFRLSGGSSTKSYDVPIIDFIPRLLAFSGSQEYVSPYWLAPACRVIDEILAPRKEHKYFAFTSARYHGKTVLMQATVVLHLLKWPREKIAYFSHGETLARTRSKDIRRTCQALGFQFSDDTNAAADWDLETGAGLRSAPITSFEHGRHYRLVIIDDPYQNADAARTASTRERVIEAIESDIIPSLSPDGAIILTHSRQHPLDAVGHYAKSKDAAWSYLNIPAIATSEHDPIGRKIGEPLWPEQWPLEKLEATRKKNAIVFETQYQGSPNTQGGNFFNEPARFNLEEFERNRPKKFRVAYGFDCAFSDSSQRRRDWSAVVKMVREINDKPEDDLYYIVEVKRFQVNAPEFVEELRKMWKRERGPMLWMRAGGPEQGVADLIRSIWAVPRSINVANNSKGARATRVSEAWNAHRVLVPGSYTDKWGDWHAEPEWVEDFLNETEVFTGTGEVDDQVDALSAAFYQLDSAPNLSGVEQPRGDTFSGASRFSSLAGRGFY